jgi:mono/diheme cytochrome c family protein
MKMKRVLKWIGIVLGSLIGLLLVVALGLYLSGSYRANKTYSFPASNLTITTDAASIENGKHWAQTLCAGCHGQDMSGKEGFFDVPAIGTIDAANLTAGKGGVGREFTSDEDYVRAIRHGIDPQGKYIFMPAVVSTANLSDQDLADIIAYLKTLPPVDHETAGHHFTPLAPIMMAAGMLGKLPVEVVSHQAHVTAPTAGATADYGKYLVDTHDCRVCHGPQLNGGNFPDPSIKKISPNLTPGGEVASWTEDQFVNTIRTGVTPGGHKLDPNLMPWQNLTGMYDDELQAIYLYLKTLPKLPQFTK